jgi:phosphate-selective porin
MSMNRIVWKGVGVVALLWLPISAWAGASDGLSDLLIEKGVITKDEVAKQKQARGLAVEGRFQARYTDPQTDDPSDSVRAFSIPQAILQASGAAFSNVLYKVEIKFAPDSATDDAGNVLGGLKVGLEDAKLTFNHFDPAPITVGHFKVPLSRQQITSSGNQQFVNRAEVVKEAQGHDVGLMVGSYEGKKPFEYAVGAFNGTKTANRNDNDDFLLVGRVAFQPLGDVQYSESNLEGDAMRFSVAASIQTNRLSKAGADGDLRSPDDEETDSTKYGVDVTMKFLSRASLAAEYIHAKKRRPAISCRGDILCCRSWSFWPGTNSMIRTTPWMTPATSAGRRWAPTIFLRNMTGSYRPTTSSRTKRTIPRRGRTKTTTRC